MLETKQKSFALQLKEIQGADEDYEWYPTTNEVVQKLKDCIKEAEAGYSYGWGRKGFGSFLDIGAGNGKVLDSIKGLEIFEKFYAIEKSQIHLSNLDPDVFILGVDFWKTTLIEKDVDVIFCNPPFKEYEAWTSRIIKEAPTGTFIYLVIPERWQNSSQITEAIKGRKLEWEIKGSFSFEDAEDRKARAKVHLLRIYIEDSHREENDPFVQFFEENFKFPEAEKSEKFEERVEQAKIVHKANLVEALCFLHDERIEELQRNYSAICSLSLEILSEFEISRESLIESLKMKLKNVKKEYWQRLFDGMDGIKKRLTHKSRQKIVSLMQDQTGIEFNRENAYAIVTWCIKNCNTHFEKQLIETYEEMVNYANIENYVSNQRVFDKKEFKYTHYKYQESNKPTHFKLKVGNRIVLEHCGGLDRHQFSVRNGLSNRAAVFIGDILTIANNLGFTPTQDGPLEYEWDDNGAREYYFKKDGEEYLLFRVRVFLNKNMHFQFDPEFIHALNIQHGKLKGWINNKKEAERESTKETSEKFFDFSLRLGKEQLLLN